MENWQHLIPELTSVFPHLTQSTDDEIKDLLNAGNNLPLTTSNVDEKIARCMLVGYDRKFFNFKNV